MKGYNEPDYEEEEMDNELEEMLEEFNPEEAAANGCSYATYRRNCISYINNRRG